MRQSLHAAWDVFRIIVGIGLLLVAGYAGWLSTLLLDMSNFRTEGSPAGTILFVVLLGAPVVALAALAGSIFLLTLRTRRGARDDEVVPTVSTTKATPRLLSRRAASKGGGHIELLIHEELAVLWMIDAHGTGLRTSNPQWRGESIYVPFRSVEGHSLRLPRGWAVPRALAVLAVDDFEQGRNWTERVSTAATPALPEALKHGPDRIRWEWLLQQYA